MGKDGTCSSTHAQASPEIIEAIGRAWAGVTVSKLVLAVDNRALRGDCSDAYSGVLRVDFRFSGEAQALIKHVVSAEFLASLPPCGIGGTPHFHAHCRNGSVRINCFIEDPPPEDSQPRDEDAAQVWTRLATVVVPMIWRPKATQ